jgi:threonylcarbamoyladenosine tRNA methylthiotransferase MtaB
VKVSVLTLGCKVNQAESSQVEGSIRAHGHSLVELSDRPEVCIINTCTVTAKSDYESRQLIRRAQKAGARVIVTGCYSELNKSAVKAMDGIIDVADNLDKLHIIKELVGLTSTGPSDIENNKSRFFVKVQDGCSFSCSYCIIPKARGASRSVAISDVTEKVSQASNLYSEVVLTGIHLGTYGYDLTPKVSLYDLVKCILSCTLIKRIRLSSLEINEINDGLLSLIQGDRVCSHLHIPLQSGDDRILRLMNRNYNVNDFLKGIDNIYKKIPDISIGTDVIAGFPGEGEREFRNTMDLLDSLPLSYIHVFPYSDRPGTKASAMPDTVSPQDKKERSSMLRGLSMAKKRAYMLRQIGKTLDAVIEERVDEYHCIGITGNYLKLKVATKENRQRDIVPVRVCGFADDMLAGHPYKSS